MITQRYGPVEHLINAAGIDGTGLLVSMTPQEIEDTIAVNLFGTIHMARGVARGMIRRRNGCIINIASILGGMKGLEGQSAYSAAKAGVLGFTKSLARELGPKGIRVSAIAPGFIETDMTADIPEKRKEAYVASTPLGRFGKAEEVAQVAVFLAQNHFMSGNTIVIDGGLTC
ncbi:hypothetical protein HK101_000418 [Irineochytrium annulatum]|nr:hypothetical protein HK101_000418 [Irineochytrium annulatum]